MDKQYEEAFLRDFRERTAQMMAQYQRAAFEQNRLAYQQYVDALAALMGQAPSPGRSQEPSADIDIEDAETRQQPAGDATGGPSSGVQTGRVSADCSSKAETSTKKTAEIKFDPFPFPSTSSFNLPTKQVYTDPKSTSSKNTTESSFEPYPFPSTSCFNPYAQCSYHPATPKSDKTGVEEPTDLSVPRGTKNIGNEEKPNSEGDDCGKTTSGRETGGSPTRQPTYTHLSDVSNDSTDETAGKKNPNVSYPNSDNDNRYGFGFVYCFPFIIHLPGSPCYFHAFLVKVMVAVAESVLLRHIDEDQLRILGEEYCIALNKFFPKYTPENTEINEVLNCGKFTGANRGKKCDRTDTDDCENINISEDTEDSLPESGQQASEEYRAQRDPPVQPRQSRAEYSTPEESPPPAADYSTPHVQPSPPPTRERVPSTRLDEVDMQSAAQSDESDVEPAPKSRSKERVPSTRLHEVDMQSAAQSDESDVEPAPESRSKEPMPSTRLDEVDMQSAAASHTSDVEPAPESRSVSFLSRHVQNCTAEGNLPETAAPKGQPAASEMPAEEPSQDHPMEPLFLVELEHPPAPETTPAPGQASASPSDRDEAGEDGERRSREPWYNTSLSSFVARYAFTVPRYVWTQRREGEPRRSRRLAMKRRVRAYYLRQRRRRN